MKKLLLASAAVPALLAGTPALAQSPCGGINFVPQSGTNCLLEPAVNSYAASNTTPIAPGGAATDLACLTGGAGKTVRVQQIRLSGLAGTVVTVPVYITKHATANSGGTAANSTNGAPLIYALDSNDASAVATATAWTAPPTVNDTAPGYIDVGNLTLIPAASATGVAGVLTFDYKERNFMQAPTLRGVAQQLCINLNGTTVSSGLVNYNFMWTEQ